MKRLCVSKKGSAGLTCIALMLCACCLKANEGTSDENVAFKDLVDIPKIRNIWSKSPKKDEIITGGGECFEIESGKP